MGLKQFEIRLSDICSDSALRNDEKYHIFLNSTGWNLFKVNKKKLISLKKILINDYNVFDFQEDEDYKGIPTGSEYLDEDGEIISHQSITLDNHPNRLKYSVSNNNILISSLRLAKSPALYFSKDDISQHVFSNGFYIFKVNKGWNIKFIIYILRTNRLKTILDNHIYRGIGISAYKQEDLLKLKIPIIAKVEQDQIISQIEPIEQKIKDLKSQNKKPQDIINRAFFKEFGFNLEQFEILKKLKKDTFDFSSFGNNKDLRNSVKFHRQAGQFVLDELKSRTSKKIKNFISEPIELGKGISPAQYDDDNGEYYYLSMATIKNWKFEKDSARLVLDKFARNNQNKTVLVNDILLARSGEGTIGKVAIIDAKELKGVFADFTMRIRLRDYNPLFAYYYFRTEYFQYLVEINKKGLGNNTNIFPSQIQEFPLLDISLDEQQRIVDKIKTEINAQEKIKLDIEAERREIDKIIEKAINSCATIQHTTTAQRISRT